MFETKNLCKISLKQAYTCLSFQNHEGLHSKVDRGFFQHCFICPSDSTVSEDAAIEHMTVATLALPVRRSNHSARSHPSRLYLIRNRLDLIRNRLDLIRKAKLKGFVFDPLC
jgi:hypothetical protein